MELNNPYLYHPHPLLKRAADDICLYISQREDWAPLFEQGKMLGALLVKSEQLKVKNSLIHSIEGEYGLLIAYSGVINGLKDEAHYFVPPIYDLANPDDFYLQEDEAISALNRQIAECTDATTIGMLKQQRKEMSLALQLKIFRHFNFLNARGEYKNVVDIFQEAKRGLPPGGTGECAAPRLLQEAYRQGLTPIALAEFWYGRSPKAFRRVHGQFYPSCIEKCSPILSYMRTLPLHTQTLPPAPPVNGGEYNELEGEIKIIFEDESIVVVSKPSGLLSVPGKDLSLPSVEAWLKERYPECKLPFMLAHRLDQATSGLLIAAKDAQTHKQLQQAFEQKTIHKRYVALLEGELPSDCGVVSLPICPNPDDRPRQTVDWQFGKPAVTRYNVLKREAGRTLVELFPLTGRTHQLRLHCASPFGLDLPIVGDKIYGPTPDPSKTLPQPSLIGREQNANEGHKFPIDRLMLHAESITLPADLFTPLPSLLTGGAGGGSAGSLKLRERIPLEFHDPASFE